MNWRRPNRAFVSGGVAIGRTVVDECGVVVDSPQKIIRIPANAGPVDSRA